METKYRKEFNPDRMFQFKSGLMGADLPFLFHWHEEIELIHGISGQFSLGLGDDTYTVRAGETVIIEPGVKHCIFPMEEEADRIAVLFDPAVILPRESSEADGDWVRGKKCYSADWPEETERRVSESILNMHCEYKEQKTGWAAAIYSELFRLKVILLREIPEEDRKHSTSAQGSALRRTLEYLGENYSRDITLKSCADDLGYNVSYLSTLFKKNTGVSFHQYLTSIRLTDAEWLLLNSGISISEVAERAGFRSLKTFHRIFAERNDVSPGMYRRRVRESGQSFARSQQIQ